MDAPRCRRYLLQVNRIQRGLPAGSLRTANLSCFDSKVLRSICREEMLLEAAMQRIRVLIVDDRWLVHRGMSSLFFDSDEVEVVGEATRETEEQISRLAPDVVVLDLTRRGSLEAIRRIRASRPQTPIMVLADGSNEGEIVDAVGEGALGCLGKGAGPKECLLAIRQVVRGEPWLPSPLALRLLQNAWPKGGSAGPNAEPLTGREIEVLRLLAKGLEDREIGLALHISMGTVRTHVSNALAKLGLRNRVEATLYALRHGLVSLDS
jgi:NarL family two-component system response regulator LiaR